MSCSFRHSETLFVSEDLRYIGPNVHISLPLGPRDRRGGELVIPCVPVGQPPAGTYRADWLFNRNRANLWTDGKPVITGPHPEDGGASVRLENVTGTNGSVTNGALRIGSLFPTVAGYYQCILYEGGVKVANNTALLYCKWEGEGRGGREGEGRGEGREEERGGEERGGEERGGGKGRREGRGEGRREPTEFRSMHVGRWSTCVALTFAQWPHSLHVAKV